MDPDTGWEHNSEDLAKVVRKAVGHRMGNGLSGLSVRDAIEHQTAMSLSEFDRVRYFALAEEDPAPAQPGDADAEPVKAVKEKIGIEPGDVVGGVRTLTRLNSGLFELVGLPVAYRRGMTCGRCPQNILEGRAEVGLVLKLAHTRIRALRKRAQEAGKIPPLPRALEERLGICRACKCSLPDAIWFSIETHGEFVDRWGSQLPADCWKLTEWRAAQAEGGVA